VVFMYSVVRVGERRALELGAKIVASARWVNGQDSERGAGDGVLHAIAAHASRAVVVRTPAAVVHSSWCCGRDGLSSHITSNSAGCTRNSYASVRTRQRCVT